MDTIIDNGTITREHNIHAGKSGVVFLRGSFTNFMVELAEYWRLCDVARVPVGERAALLETINPAFAATFRKVIVGDYIVAS